MTHKETPRTSRKFELISLFAAPDMGKTWLMRYLMAVYALERPGVPIIPLDPSFQYPGGEFDHRFYEDPALLGDWFKGISNDGMGPFAPATIYKRRRMEKGLPVVDHRGALVLFDDGDRVLDPTQGGVSPAFQHAWKANRHLCLDIILSSHRTQGVPKEGIANSSKIILGCVEEPHCIKYLSKLLGFPVEGRMPTQPRRFLVIERFPRREYLLNTETLRLPAAPKRRAP